ncbi:kinase-like domain-containing protein [Geopyxis carbonaria]|nr:kinase-like domain-containing protein [Geopyxis carbonaria]
MPTSFNHDPPQNNDFDGEPAPKRLRQSVEPADTPSVAPDTLASIEETERYTRLFRLNRNLVQTLLRCVNADGTVDLQPHLEQAAKSYTGRRQLQLERVAQAVAEKIAETTNLASEHSLEKGSNDNSTTVADTTNGEAPQLPATSFTSVAFFPEGAHRWNSRQKRNLLPSNESTIQILRPLSPEAIALLGESPNISHLSTLLLSAKPLFFNDFGKFVLNLTPSLTIKIVPTEITTAVRQIDLLAYIHKHAPTVPIPVCHGLFQIGNTSYTLMTHYPGPTLAALWPALADDKKIHIREQLNDIIAALGELEWSGDALGWGGTTVDSRRHRRTTSEALPNVRAFNRWLLSNPLPGVSKERLDYLCRRLDALDYRVVMTHADLCPRNIMLDEDGATVAGIIDWENAGWYPRWWEYVKAADGAEEAGWEEFLPPLVRVDGWDREWALDKVVESVVMQS